jgi:universal stress protein A
MTTQTNLIAVPLDPGTHAAVTALETRSSEKRVLVAIDFGNESKAVLRMAEAWAASNGARLTLLHVVEPPSFMSGMDALPLTKTTEQVTTEALGRLERWSRHVAKVAGEVETIVRVGTPHREIASAALEMRAELVVISDSARNWFERLFLRTVAAKLKRRLSCPLLALTPASHTHWLALPVQRAPEEAWRVSFSPKSTSRPSGRGATSTAAA